VQAWAVWHCQTKFYTAIWCSGEGRSLTVLAQESPPRSARFDAEYDLYSFVLTVPSGAPHVQAAETSPSIEVGVDVRTDTAAAQDGVTPQLI